MQVYTLFRSKPAVVELHLFTAAQQREPYPLARDLLTFGMLSLVKTIRSSRPQSYKADEDYIVSSSDDEDSGKCLALVCGAPRINARDSAPGLSCLAAAINVGNAENSPLVVLLGTVVLPCAGVDDALPCSLLLDIANALGKAREGTRLCVVDSTAGDLPPQTPALIEVLSKLLPPAVSLTHGGSMGANGLSRVSVNLSAMAGGDSAAAAASPAPPSSFDVFAGRLDRTSRKSVSVDLLTPNTASVLLVRGVDRERVPRAVNFVTSAEVRKRCISRPSSACSGISSGRE